MVATDGKRLIHVSRSAEAETLADAANALLESVGDSDVKGIRLSLAADDTANCPIVLSRDSQGETGRAIIMPLASQR